MTLLTEEEAKKRWCPFAKYAAAGPHPSWPEMPTIIAPQARAWGFAQDSYAFPQNCIASECMAWRQYDWEPSEQIWEQGGGSYTTETPQPARGFCGLAGRPE